MRRVDGSILALVAVLGLLPAVIAKRKGHSFLAFWLMGAMFFIVALPWALLIRPNPVVFQQCPHCRERASAQATACPHCGRDLPVKAYVSEDATKKGR